VGLRKALKEKEKIRVPRKQISEDLAEEINRILISINIEDVITVLYYDETEQQYFQLTGIVKTIDEFEKTIQIEKTGIKFDDIFQINKN